MIIVIFILITLITIVNSTLKCFKLTQSKSITIFFCFGVSIVDIILAGVSFYATVLGGFAGNGGILLLGLLGVTGVFFVPWGLLQILQNYLNNHSNTKKFNK